MLDLLARMYLTDERGQEMFLVSIDKWLPTVSGIPISPFSDIKRKFAFCSCISAYVIARNIVNFNINSYVFVATADRIIANFLKGGIIPKWLSIGAAFHTTAGMKTGRARCAEAQNSTQPNTSITGCYSNSDLVSKSQIAYPMYLLVAGLIGGFVQFTMETCIIRRWSKSTNTFEFD
jgi:hypothetical protein